MFNVFKKLRAILSFSLVVIFLLGFGFVRLFASSDLYSGPQKHHVIATRLVLLCKTEKDNNETQNELRDNIGLVNLLSSGLLSTPEYSFTAQKQCVLQPSNYPQAEKLCLHCRYNI